MTVLRRLLTIILYSRAGFSVFSTGFSVLIAAIGRFFKIDGGLGGLFSFSGTGAADLMQLFNIIIIKFYIKVVHY